MLVKKVCRSLKRFGMIGSGERVLVALSGGPDSVALTHALVELAATEVFELRFAHLNHQLREDGDADEAFCAELAARLDLPFSSHRIDVAAEAQRNGYSLEEQARISRYRFLSETAERWQCAGIAVGHTRDDQAETFLLRLLRGSGTTGLAAIRPVTSMPTSFSPSSKAGVARLARLLRPMLEVTRSRSARVSRCEGNRLPPGPYQLRPIDPAEPRPAPYAALFGAPPQPECNRHPSPDGRTPTRRRGLDGAGGEANARLPNRGLGASWEPYSAVG